MQGISTSLIFTLIIILAFAASKLVNYFGRNSSFVKISVFFILGTLLGPNFNNALVSADGMSSLKILAYILGSSLSFWIGLKLLPSKTEKYLISKTFIIYIFSSGLFFMMFVSLFFIVGRKYFGINSIEDFYQSRYYYLILFLSFVFPYSSGLIHFFTTKDVKSSGVVFPFINQVNNALQFWVIIALGLLTFSTQLFSGFTDHQVTSTHAIVTLSMLAIGPLLGFLLTQFIGKSNQENRIILATLGGVFFAAGLGFHLGCGVLLINVLMGIMVSKLYKDADKLAKIIQAQRQPILAIVLVVASSNISIPSFEIIGLAALFITLRFAFIQFLLAKQITLFFFKTPNHFQFLGRGVLAQDTVIVVLAMMIGEYYPEISSEIIFISLINLLFFEIVGLNKARAMLIDCDELKKVEGIFSPKS
ncbi:hypothetical protein N9N67_00990 [Bacteriovoracaceae bacterium]|nr:hypothetical protein [Bacteriovoracaceae bacterium]